MAKQLSLKERLAQKREDIKNKSKSFAYYAIKEGTTRFRHLPVGEEKDWSIEAICFFLGMEIGLVISPATFGEKCALMQAHTELSSSKSEKDRELAKRLKPSRKFFSPVVKYLDEKGKDLDVDGGAKLLALTPGTVNEVIDLFLDEDEAGDFTNPQTGYDLKYSRTGKGKMDTEYTVRACKPTALRNKKFAGKTYDPEAMLREIMSSYKDTKVKLEKFLNLPAEGEEQPKSGVKKKKKKRSTDM